jgi:hypothetical protein
MNPWIPHLLRAGGGVGGPVLPPTGRTMLANLTSSLILDEGTGDPTWSRATKAWGFNELGYLEELASGCAFFGGARLVRNRATGNSHTLSGTTSARLENIVANAADPFGGTSAFGATLTTDSGQHYTRYSSSAYEGREICASCYVNRGYVNRHVSIKSGASAQVFNLDTLSWVSGSPVIARGYEVIDSSWIRIYSTALMASGTQYFEVGWWSSSGTSSFAGAGESVSAYGMQIEDVTGQADKTPSEYVSVGVLSAPFFGAGIDGAKYFETDWQGAPIAAANLLGFRREAAATNNLLYSRDLSNAAWSTKTNITAAKTATGLDGIANTATTLTATAADATILQPITLASAARCASAYIKRRTGTGTISFTQDGGSTWTDITAQINGSTWSRVEITATLANPSVGFKISTSGDAIDVDCVQNEAGTVATSPIVTTTAAVTRNADSLTYQTASNIDFAVGTVFCEISSYSYLSTRIALEVGASGWSYIHSADANTVWKAYDGTNVVAKSGLSNISTAKRKRVVSWGTGLKVTGDGLTPASGSFDGSFGTGATMSVGKDINGYIGPVAIYNYQMTEAEQQAITA